MSNSSYDQYWDTSDRNMQYILTVTKTLTVEADSEELAISKMAEAKVVTVNVVAKLRPEPRPATPQLTPPAPPGLPKGMTFIPNAPVHS